MKLGGGACCGQLPPFAILSDQSFKGPVDSENRQTVDGSTPSGESSSSSSVLMDGPLSFVGVRRRGVGRLGGLALGLKQGRATEQFADQALLAILAVHEGLQVEKLLTSPQQIFKRASLIYISAQILVVEISGEFFDGR